MSKEGAIGGVCVDSIEQGIRRIDRNAADALMGGRVGRRIEDAVAGGGVGGKHPRVGELGEVTGGGS